MTKTSRARQLVTRSLTVWAEVSSLETEWFLVTFADATTKDLQIPLAQAVELEKAGVDIKAMPPSLSDWEV